MFDGKNKKVEYLEEERKKIWERIMILEKKIEEKTSDNEKEARQASKKAAEYKNKANERLEAINETYNKIIIHEKDISEKSLKVSRIHDETLENNLTIIKNGHELSNILKKIQELLSDHPEIESEIEEINNFIEKIEENFSKASSTYKSILVKKAAVDELYREINGYEEEDENGIKIFIEGLKTKLSTVYDDLKERSKKFELTLESLNNDTINKFETFVDSSREDLEQLRVNFDNNYDSIYKRIQSLLPDAMTAGLSSAFINKKKDEEKLFKEYKINFKWGIILLSLVSCIPLAINIIFLIDGVPLMTVIEKSPKLFLSLMPLYAPLIWLTISANKKVNLSKRLIEEYSHKQVLSMTIEGLSKQIENIQDNGLSEELRVKLLQNFLVVSNENPGKLISNYQKSDNPLFNILDKDNKDSTILKTSEKTKETVAIKTEGENETPE